MPCDQRQVITLDWAKVDQAILASAFEQLGLRNIGGETVTTVHGKTITRPELTYGAYVNDIWTCASWRNGQLVFTGAKTVDLEKQVRRAYGEQTVRAAAKRFGWNVQQDKQQKFVIRRRA